MLKTLISHPTVHFNHCCQCSINLGIKAYYLSKRCWFATWSHAQEIHKICSKLPARETISNHLILFQQRMSLFWCICIPPPFSLILLPILSFALIPWVSGLVPFFIHSSCSIFKLTFWPIFWIIVSTFQIVLTLNSACWATFEGANWFPGYSVSTGINRTDFAKLFWKA